MRRTVARLGACVALSFLGWSAQAREMERIPDGEADCELVRLDGGYCLEWRLTSDPDIRISMWGYEDGGRTDLYRRHGPGRFVHIARIDPVFRRPGESGRYSWAMHYEVDDIVVRQTPRGPRLFATFDHDYVDTEGPDAEPERKTRIPLVLFTGKQETEQSGLAGGPLRAVSLDTLQRNEQASGVHKWSDTRVEIQARVQSFGIDYDHFVDGSYSETPVSVVVVDEPASHRGRTIRIFHATSDPGSRWTSVGTVLRLEVSASALADSDALYPASDVRLIQP